MKEKDRIVLVRSLCAVGLILLTGGMILRSSLQNVSNYTPFVTEAAVMPLAAPAPTMASVEEPADSRDVLRLSFVGNCIVGSMLGSSAYGTFNELMAAEGPDYFLSKAAPLLKADDWTVCALGSVFSDGDLTPTSKNSDELTWYLSGTEGARVLSSGGIEVASLATDHTHDYGDEGYEDTKAALEKNGITWGDGDKAVYLERHGVRIGVYPCMLRDAETDPARILTWVESAKDSCDLVVVYPHGHLNLSAEDGALLDTYETMIDAGADLVLATHDTVAREPIAYKDGVILPSLGSFLSGDTRFPSMDIGVYQLHITCGEAGIEAWSGEWIPFLAYDEPWQPLPAGEKNPSA